MLLINFEKQNRNQEDKSDSNNLKQIETVKLIISFLLHASPNTPFLIAPMVIDVH